MVTQSPIQKQNFKKYILLLTFGFLGVTLTTVFSFGISSIESNSPTSFSFNSSIQQENTNTNLPLDSYISSLSSEKPVVSKIERVITDAQKDSTIQSRCYDILKQITSTITADQFNSFQTSKFSASPCVYDVYVQYFTSNTLTYDEMCTLSSFEICSRVVGINSAKKYSSFKSAEETCTALGSQSAKGYCISGALSEIIKNTDKNNIDTKIIDVCEEISRLYISQCVYEYTRSMDNLSSIQDICESIITLYQESCVNGLIDKSVKLYPFEAHSVSDVCESISNYASSCVSKAAQSHNFLTLNSDQELVSFCLSMQEKYQDVCLQ